MNDRQRLEAIVAVVCKYLPPDGISKEDALREIIGLIDPLPEQDISYTDIQMAELIMSDCGHSSDYTPLLNRIAGRLATYRQALAQPEQEHIECGYDETVGMCTNNPCCEQAQPEQEELIQFKDGKWSYVRKPWVGLTEDEIQHSISLLLEDDPTPLLTLADVIQEKLKELNT